MANRVITLTKGRDFFSDNDSASYLNDDVILGRNGSDQILSYGGSDSLFGMAGNDVLEFHTEDLAKDKHVELFAKGGSGNDWVEIYADNFNGSAELRGGPGLDSLWIEKLSDDWRVDEDSNKVVNTKNGNEIDWSGFRTVYINLVEYDI
jgi:hypothetical protein